MVVEQVYKMSIKGILWKWTNYWTGWQPRYFILEDGILSYYKSEEEVHQGCKGSVCVSACDISVHPTDNLRLDICIPGEALQIYVRAASPTERQNWLVALGSTKAQGLDSRSRKHSEPPQDTIKTKRSELKLYATLLMQTVHSIKEASNSSTPDINKLDECSSLLSATCDTFINTLDSLVNAATTANTFVSPNPQTVVPPPILLHPKNKCITHSNSN